MEKKGDLVKLEGFDITNGESIEVEKEKVVALKAIWPRRERGNEPEGDEQGLNLHMYIICEDNDGELKVVCKDESEKKIVIIAGDGQLKRPGENLDDEKKLKLLVATALALGDYGKIPSKTVQGVPDGAYGVYIGRAKS